MVPESVIAGLAQAGVRIRAEGEELRVGPRESVTPEIAELVRANRDSLLAACKLQASDDRMNAAWDFLLQDDRKYHLLFEEVGPVVIATLAIRGVGTCELSLPADQFDYGRVVAAMERVECAG